jgi:hypothetical protein
LSAYGEWTKKSGYYEWANGKLKEHVYEDASYGNPVKALKADVLLFTRQTFVEFPDLRVSGPGSGGTGSISWTTPCESSPVGGVPTFVEFRNSLFNLLLKSPPFQFRSTKLTLAIQLPI